MTKKIPLTQGKFATVDDSDYVQLSQHKWHAQFIYNKFYAARHSGNKYIYMHREIMDVNDPTVKVDHRDGDGLNNQRSNLRNGTHKQNLCNRGPQANNTSGYKGVFATGKKFLAYIKHNQKFIRIGEFDTAEEAAKARDAKAKELHGEFAWTNF